jgi:hypothetical protein
MFHLLAVYSAVVIFLLICFIIGILTPSPLAFAVAMIFVFFALFCLFTYLAKKDGPSWPGSGY